MSREAGGTRGLVQEREESLTHQTCGRLDGKTCGSRGNTRDERWILAQRPGDDVASRVDKPGHGVAGFGDNAGENRRIIHTPVVKQEIRHGVEYAEGV